MTTQEDAANVPANGSAGSLGIGASSPIRNTTSRHFVCSMKWQTAART
jgi:hypothetical protein